MLNVFIPSPVAVRLREGERVGKVADFADGAVGEEDFDDVETDFYLGIFEAAEIVQSGLGEEATFAGIDEGGGAGPFLGGTGFYFNKDEAVGVAEDEVYFAAFGIEIGGEIFEAGLLEVLFGSALAQGAALVFHWFRSAGQARFELFQELHRG